LNSKSEAGTVVYFNYFTFTSIGVRRAVSTNKRIIRFRRADQEITDVEMTTTTSLRLLIKVTELRYTFGYQDAGCNVVWIGSVDIDVMTKDPPIGMPFSGMMFGLYACGESEPCVNPAVFEHVEFQQ
jgi:hypothetical protein